MKKILLIVIVSFCITSIHAQYDFDRNKIEKIRWTPKPEKVIGLSKHIIDLNGNWKFSTKPEQGFYKKNTIPQWDNIEVPGEWIMQGFNVEANNNAGYHRSFIVPKEWNGYRIKLKCEAIYSKCNIWVNGKEVGTHLGGFTPFEFDVTDLIKQGKNNIAVAVRSESLADTLSSASKYAVHPLGGITRPIYLMAVPEVNLASFHVSTKFDENFEDANLNVEISLANESFNTKEASLEFTLTDLNGKIISFNGDDNYKIALEKEEKKKFTTTLKVKKPLKWDCEHPNLYYLNCKVLLEGKDVNTISKRFGFRQIDVIGNQVFVNNKVIKLKGVCRHEVDPLRGRSLTGNQWYEDVKLFKEGNVNYIRTSHYPPNEKLLEACDELGMFVEEEAPFCWVSKKHINNENYFEAILQPTLEMVERDKSHPSIIYWSLANESGNFKELYKISADLVKGLDPSRPRIFSQLGENSDGGYLEIGNNHYPGPPGPKKFSQHKRPVIFDEYCHLNAYNRFELMTDPGLRDIWGDALSEMWENMYKTPAILGGALWAGIDDSFFLPSGESVGYGTWGPIDGWRRKKPEFWHMKKAYSPVKVELMEGNKQEEVSLKIENRYFFTNLNECKIVWKNNGKKGVLNPKIDPGKIKEVKLPIKYFELESLSVDVFKDGKVPVDQYLYDFSKPELIFTSKENYTFKTNQAAGKFTAISSFIKVEITKQKLQISDKNGNSIIEDWPALMLVPLNRFGAGIKMTKETPEFDIFSPVAKNRKIESITISSSKTEINIVLADTYHQAAGTIELKVSATGGLNVSYNFAILEDIDPRQWGLAFKLSEKINELSWKRKGLWSVYPEDHVGRLQGEASLFYENDMCGLAGPATLPGWSWSKDQNRYGSNDFRSTKRNILNASLNRKDTGTGINLKSNGLQHIRCWAENGNTHILIADYDNLGAENYLKGKGYRAKWYKPLSKADSINGGIAIEITND